MDKKRILIAIGVVLFIMIAAAAAILTATSQSETPVSEPDITYTGNMVCLPHKNAGSGEPKTLECAIGLKTIDDKYYALKDLPQQSQNVEFSTIITVKGGIEPPASNEKYDIKGTIKVTEFRVDSSN